MKIIVDDLLNGNPRLTNIEMTVLDVVTDSHYEGVESFLARSTLRKKDLIQVLKYCKNRQCDSSGGHCGGCSLRLPDDGIHNLTDFTNRFSEIKFLESSEVLKGTGQGVMILPGDETELESTWRGVNGWQIASEVLRKVSSE